MFLKVKISKTILVLLSFKKFKQKFIMKQIHSWKDLTAIKQKSRRLEIVSLIIFKMNVCQKI